LTRLVWTSLDFNLSKIKINFYIGVLTSVKTGVKHLATDYER